MDPPREEKMRVIAIEEHFITPMYRERVAANEFRGFYLSARSRELGHDIFEENLDLGARRLAHMDEAGVDLQVLSFGSPGAQAFGPEVAIPMTPTSGCTRQFKSIRRASPALPRCPRRTPRRLPASSSAACASSASSAP
jgi:predicted TIM-barrel fold metal-dependent hydrolase